MIDDVSPEKKHPAGGKILDLKNLNDFQKKRKNKSSRKKIFTAIIIILLATGFWYGARANQALENISAKDGTLLEKILHLLPIDKSFLLRLPIERSVFEEPDTEEKRVNYLILGIRGAGDPNGGLLTDSMLIVSVRPFDEKVAIISVPRDLYVTMPGLGGQRKLNEAYEIGAEKFPGRGLEYARSIVSEVSGMTIHYAVIINFTGFKDFIDSLGGVEIALDKPFSEPVPFEEGIISLPSGRQTIDGDTALLYARARMSSSDFDRSRRQEQIVKGVYDKLLKTRILLNPYRLNKILNVLENNLKTDMKSWETEETIKLFSSLESPQIKTKVIDNGPEKLLYSSYSGDGAFILLPTGGNYEKIHEAVRNMLNQ
jgi:LCP family protein required for cell wall assembly